MAEQSVGFTEYKVRPVTRYIVTRYEERYPNGKDSPCSAKSEQKGEFDNHRIAFEVARALARSEEAQLENQQMDLVELETGGLSDDEIELVCQHCGKREIAQKFEDRSN